MFDNLKCIDISPLISERTAVFPGDTKFGRKLLMDFEKKDNLTLSAIELSPHVGAHADAPNHYSAEGVGIHERDLDYYMGACQVVTVKLALGERIRKSHLAAVRIEAPRVLFKTGSFPSPNEWTDTFNSLSAEVVNYLAQEKNVKLVGIDTPSIDLADDKILESHQAVCENNMAILEGIVLDKVKDGLYTLVALPLKIEGCDASPVRAVLLEDW